MSRLFCEEMRNIEIVHSKAHRPFCKFLHITTLGISRVVYTLYNRFLCYTLCKVNCFKCIRYPVRCTNRWDTFSRIFKKLPLTYKTKYNTLIGDWESTTTCHNKLHNSSQRQLIKFESWWPSFGTGMIFHFSKATHRIPFKKSSRKTDDVVPLRAVKRQQILRCMLRGFLHLSLSQ